VDFEYVVVGTMALTACAVWNYIAKSRRSREGFCAVCGYDLRATPQRCPECGAIPSG